MGADIESDPEGREMAKAGDWLEMGPLGCRVQIIRTAQDTGGELEEFDVVGRPRGFLIQSHVHVGQSEHYEVMGGTMKVGEGAPEHWLRPGETMQVGAATPPRQLPADDYPNGRVRIQTRPA